MATSYGLIFIAFVPLFVAFILLLKRHFVTIYDESKIRLYVSFVLFMLVMGFRFFLYNLLEFSDKTWLSIESLDGEIPLYVSEIFIALCYMKLMVSNARRKQEAGQTSATIESDTSHLE